jgi:hypothetical protein
MGPCRRDSIAQDSGLSLEGSSAAKGSQEDAAAMVQVLAGPRTAFKAQAQAPSFITH